MIKRICSRWLVPVSLSAAMLTLGLILFASPRSRGAEDVEARVLEAENKRIATIELVTPSVCAIFAPKFDNGGSGVIISDDGYALTNFHVVNACGNVMRVGLSDGKLYDAVLVGLDKVGDVALIKLLPKKEGDKFHFAKLGDSDKARAGDWSLAMGNPFLLATDFKPTVTFGLISGVHRYQYPAGLLLEYTDCIQIDTSINPGNSGGPLFNLDGELLGINGRGSFDKRGRVNSGVGYAISINQIKNFMGQLRAGMDTDHASSGFAIVNDEESQVSKVVVTSILGDCDAKRRGIDLGDQIVSFASRPVHSQNQFKNVLGIYPRGWRVPLVFKHGTEKANERREVLVRLMGIQKQEIPDPTMPPAPPGPKPPQPKQPQLNSPATKMYEAKPGFANYYFNKLERDKLLAGFRKQGDFTAFKGDWKIEADVTIQGKPRKAVIEIQDRGARDKVSPAIKATIDGIDFVLEPFSSDAKGDAILPEGSGGFLMAMFQWRQLLTIGEKGFTKSYSHGGVEPFYTLPAKEERPDYAKLRTDSEVLRTEGALSQPAKWYFTKAAEPVMLGFEMWLDREKDPCEVYFSTYKEIKGGQKLPHHFEVRYSDKTYAVFDVTSFELKEAAK